MRATIVLVTSEMEENTTRIEAQKGDPLTYGQLGGGKESLSA